MSFDMAFPNCPILHIAAFLQIPFVLLSISSGLSTSLKQAEVLRVIRLVSQLGKDGSIADRCTLRRRKVSIVIGKLSQKRELCLAAMGGEILRF